LTLEVLLTARRDIQDGVFLKVFEQIRKLVKDQLDQVQRKSGRVKVHVFKYEYYLTVLQTMFLVGGFGSNQYLYDYLKSKFSGLNIQQPAVG
jgi:hypothetical protein